MKHLTLLAAALLCLASCDEGRLYNDLVVAEQEGGSARLTTTVAGLESWPEGYTAALAGFADGNEYALVSKNIDGGVSDCTVNIVLSGIPPEVSTVELCVLDRLRRKVASFAAVDYIAGSDTLQLTPLSVNLSMYGAIQREIFNTTCIQCHGGSNFSAAGLNLTEGLSYDQLVGVASVKMPALRRVEAGESGASVLYMILESECSATWNYDHSVEVLRQEKLDLIKNWIDSGAKQ